jgi:ABC-2 type transport system ATP-binding protein
MTINLIVEEVTTKYKNFVISNINFNIESGDILGLVGRSGSGKSTIIKTIVGLKKLDKGKIISKFNDQILDLQEIIGYSPQDNALFPLLTLEENIITFAKLHNVTKIDLIDRMNYLLKRLDLVNCKDKKINQLSGGMQKRCDLAITLIHSPKIIVLDEPFNGLDISLQKFIWNLLKELAKQGCIIIISSHLLIDIKKNCNKFGLVEKGIYYNSNQISNLMLNRNENNFENMLEKLFDEDLINESK